MSRFLVKKLDALKPYTPGEQPRNMEALLKLNTNESPFPPSPRVIEAIKSAELGDLRLYPDFGCTELVDALAKHCNVAPAQIFPANGSDEALAFIFHGLCGTGAAFADVTYGFYPVFADMFGVSTEIIPLRENFSINISDYVKTKATVFVANPNAPTGICLPLTDIEALLKQNRSRLVVIDEAYVDFGGESAIGLLNKYDNLLVIQTLSKSRSLAGGRIGCAIGSEELIADLNTMRFSFNPYNLNMLSILAGRAAIEDVEYFDYSREKIISARRYTISTLRALGFTVLESSANFVFAGNHRTLSGWEYFDKLRENGILVRYFPAPRTKNYVRITIGTQEQMQRLIEVTEEICK